jgi:hypothetical protein
MTDAQSTGRAVARLASDERAEFRRGFTEFDAAAWAAQLAANAMSGRLDGLADEAWADYGSGQAREISDTSPARVSGAAPTPGPRRFKRWPGATLDHCGSIRPAHRCNSKCPPAGAVAACA